MHWDSVILNKLQLFYFIFFSFSLSLAPFWCAGSFSLWQASVSFANMCWDGSWLARCQRNLVRCVACRSVCCVLKIVLLVSLLVLTLQPLCPDTHSTLSLLLKDGNTAAGPCITDSCPPSLLPNLKSNSLQINWTKIRYSRSWISHFILGLFLLSQHAWCFLCPNRIFSRERMGRTDSKSVHTRS